MSSIDLSVCQKILIVDDRPENLLALRTVLSELDVELIEATNGNDALAATLYHGFALAILDIVMPGMNGYELAHLLRGDPRTGRLPIIFMTAAYGEEDHIFQGYEAGAVDYIVKPYDPRVLLSKVNIFLDLDRKSTALAEKLEALAASEERFRSLVMTVPDIVYRIDRDGRFTFLNDAIYDLGYKPEDLIGKDFSEIMLPADAEAVRRESMPLKQPGKQTQPVNAPLLLDERHPRPHKTSGLEVHLVPRRSEQPGPELFHSDNAGLMIAEVSSSGLYSAPFSRGQSVFLGSVGIIRNITERKQAEEELERYRKHLEELVEERTAELHQRTGEIQFAAQQWQATFDAMRDGVALLDANLRILRCNNALVELAGQPCLALVGQSCCWAVHGFAEPSPECPALRTSRSLRRETQQTIIRDFWFEVTADPILDEAGRLTGIVHIVADITERKRAEVEIHRLNADLERRVAERTVELTAANRELESFAYAVSHDLRAPLRAMSGFSQALIEDYGARLPDEARSYLEQIDRAGCKMGELIDGLLILSRSTRGGLQRDEVDLAELSERLLAELARSEPERSVAVAVEAGLQVYGDARMIEVVMRNLLSNAWKYTAHATAPCIRVYAEERAGHRWFCVADNGAGFNMAYVGKLFQPFQRLHRQEEFPGIGIGLATVQRIITRHGGVIEAKGELGRGAEFHFTLPDLSTNSMRAEETK